MNDAIALGALFAIVLALTLLGGKPAIAALRRLSFEQRAYEDAPQTHAKKSGTPTMGGIFFAVGLAAAALAHPDAATLAIVALGALCAAIGFADDFISIRRGRNRGLRAREKFALTILAALVFLALADRASVPSVRDAILRLGGVAVHVPHPLWYALGLFAIVGTAHAVNLTDGLDGLAGGTTLPPLAVFAWLGWVAGVRGVTFVDVAVAATIVGFLAFNRHPARVFMGDTGSLALGGVLAGSAVLSGSTLLLPIVGGVFAAEALSVILQVSYFKMTRKRIFLMSPLHHHFELAGWPETKVTGRFWTASVLCSLAGAVLAR